MAHRLGREGEAGGEVRRVAMARVRERRIERRRAREQAGVPFCASLGRHGGLVGPGLGCPWCFLGTGYSLRLMVKKSISMAQAVRTSENDERSTESKLLESKRKGTISVGSVGRKI